MNINGDVHFDGWPRADVKDFTSDGPPGFCVLRMVDIDRKQHQFFLKPEHLAKARLVAAAFNGHEGLVAALELCEATFVKGTEGTLSETDLERQVRAALALARGDAA